MSIASKYNHGRKFTFEIPENFEYASLADLYNNNGADFVYCVRALYINHKGKFGDAPVAVTSGEIVNLPKYLLEAVEAIRRDAEAVDAINNQQFGFRIRVYNNNGRTCYTVNWVDM